MKECNVRQACRDDMPYIMGFIDMYWKKNHILARDKALFDWQYGQEDASDLNMMIGTDQGEVQGVLGFVPYGSTNEKDIALALWKANPATGFLGIKLLLYLLQKIPNRNLFCVGINPATTGDIYRHMKLKTGTMHQWYRLRALSNYKIAAIQSKSIPLYIGEQAELVQYQTFDELLSAFDYDQYVTKEQIPYKSKAYFEKRYYRHPSYQYLVYGIKHDEEVRATIVLRVQECNGARAIRFVDCIGDYSQIGLATAGLDLLLEQFDAEYIDIYEVGLSEKMLSGAGWLKVKDTNNIIPNYFSPFEQRVVDIHYCTSNPDIVLFRGDGDQDRPN